MMAEFGLLGVPSSAAAHGPGQEKAPAALRRAGLSERLVAAGMRIVDYGDLPVVRWRPDPHQRRPHILQADARRAPRHRRAASRPLVIESIRRQLPPDSDPDLLVFTGPEGGNGVPVGTRTMLSRYNFRRVYQRAVARAGDDLVAVDPHGPLDLRHTFSTWMEDASTPARVIDERMGHERSRRGELGGWESHWCSISPHQAGDGRARGRAIQERLVVVVQVVEATLQADDSGGRVF